MLEPRDIDILISGPKKSRETPRSRAMKVMIIVSSMMVIGYIGLTSLCNIIYPPPKPWILVRNTNISNPDLASFKNCSWSEFDKVIIPIDESRPFSFGYLYKNEYRIVKIDTTKDPHFDDSAAFWGGLDDDGEVWSYFPFEIQRPLMPGNARLLRKMWKESPSKTNGKTTSKEKKRV